MVPESKGKCLNLRVVGNGEFYDTIVYDRDTGEQIRNVIKVELALVAEARPVIRLEILADGSEFVLKPDAVRPVPT